MKQPIGKVVTGTAGPAIRVSARPYSALSTDVRQPSAWDTPIGQAMKRALIQRAVTTAAVYGTVIGGRIAIKHAVRVVRRRRAARLAGSKGSGTGGAGRG